MQGFYFKSPDSRVFLFRSLFHTIHFSPDILDCPILDADLDFRSAEKTAMEDLGQHFGQGLFQLGNLLGVSGSGRVFHGERMYIK
jgi:hypothetical protein